MSYRALFGLLCACSAAWGGEKIGPTGNRTTGDCPVIFLRVEFPGFKMKQPLEYFYNPSKGSGLVDQMAAYYKEVSGGKLRIRPIVSRRVYMVNNIRPYYRGRAQALVREAVAAANAPPPEGEGDRLDFARAQTVVVFFAGTGVESDTNKDSPLDLWSHFFTVEPYVCEADGVKLKDAILIAEHESNERNPKIEFSPLGVLCHEFGHHLGLPDLYPPDGSHEGIGVWGLMSHGLWLNGGKTPGHPCAWCKVALGWIEPTLLMSDQIGVKLPAIETSHQAIKIWAKDSTTPNEYFLLANRQRIGFDRYLPGSGLLIWHIDESVTGFRTCNSNVNHKRVDLEAADGLPCDLDRPRSRGGNRGDAGDPWANQVVGFTPHSFPSSKPYSGGPGRVAITHISKSGPVMTFDVTIVPPGGEVAAPKARSTVTIVEEKGGRRRVVSPEEFSTMARPDAMVANSRRTPARSLNVTKWNGRIIPRTHVDLTKMILVPAGKYKVGSNDFDEDEKPERIVEVKAFYIDKYAVSNAEYKKFVDAVHYPPPRSSVLTAKAYSWRGDMYPEGKGDLPVVLVSWIDAANYAKWAGKRLPTEIEWEVAARGPKGYIYPWGNVWDPTKLNCNRQGPEPVNAFAGGVSPFGCYNMAGNVWEWCQNWYDNGYGKALRGGCWSTDYPRYQRASNRYWQYPTHKSILIGFRCAISADRVKKR